MAKDHPFTFLDHSLRCGDSLIGLSREQIAAFHWQPPAKRSKDDVWFGDPIAERMRTVTEYRQRILAARDDKPYEQLRQELDVADEALSLARLTGDCVIAAYFSAGKDRERVAKLDTLARQLVQYLGPQRRIEDRQPLTEAVASLHGGDHPLQPFHWQIEFPEVFTDVAHAARVRSDVGEDDQTHAGRVRHSGFDAIVGNPPFAGKNTLIKGNREGYLDWLKTLHEESHGNADLVAHFFRRAFNLLRPNTSPKRERVNETADSQSVTKNALAGAAGLYGEEFHGGCFGLIATNTIGQGDTRSTCQRWICTHGGTIYAARKRFKWPGQAAVIVSVVNVCRGATHGPFVLDARDVPSITAFLFHTGGHDDPSVMQSNEGTCFNGACVLGMGFTFDDSDNGSAATSIAEMHRLCADDPRNAELIFPYIGGEEINNSPTHSHHRYIINFGNMSEDDARKWPDMMRIVEDKVKPVRLTDNRSAYRTYWWQYAEKRAELRQVLLDCVRVIVVARVGQALAFTFSSSKMVFSEQVVVIPRSGNEAFAVLLSRVYETWARYFASWLKDDLRYSPSDCYDTFAFPAGVLEHAAGDSTTTDNGPLTTLETAGREYYEFRAALMVRHNEGLTKTYNRFHDPHETSPDILQLRALHAAMDRAVLEAYGWHDLAQTATCEFLLDYEDDEDEDEGSGTRSPGTGRQKKKPWRYRWPDPFRDEVLARLLELNKQRAEQERLIGPDSSPKKVRTKNPRTKKKDETGLFPPD